MCIAGELPPISQAILLIHLSLMLLFTYSALLHSNHSNWVIVQVLYSPFGTQWNKSLSHQTLPTFGGSTVNSSFSPSRFWTHHDNRFLYMLLEYVAGGELFTYLRTVHRFDNPTSIFFASEIVMALDYLHSQDMVYR